MGCQGAAVPGGLDHDGTSGNDGGAGVPSGWPEQAGGPPPWR